MDAWIKYGGGQELWDEVSDQFGLKAFADGNTGVQMGGWFNKEMNSAADFKGLKMRIPGLGGDVLAKLGASPVSLPGGQIYENLVSGAIDATEWVGPYNDYFMKFYEAAKYYYYPGFHEPGSQASLRHEQVLVEQAVEDPTRRSSRRPATKRMRARWPKPLANNGTYLDKLVKDHGVKLKKFSDEIYDSFGKASAEVFAETRAHDALTAKIYDSFVNARKNIGGLDRLRGRSLCRQRNRVLGI